MSDNSNAAGAKSSQVWTADASLAHPNDTSSPQVHQNSNSANDNLYGASAPNGSPPTSNVIHQSSYAPSTSLAQLVPTVGQQVVLTVPPHGNIAPTMQQVPPAYAPYASGNMQQGAGAGQTPPYSWPTQQPLGSAYGNNAYPQPVGGANNAPVILGPPIVYAPSNATTYHSGHPMVYATGISPKFHRRCYIIGWTVSIITFVTAVIIIIVMTATML